MVADGMVATADEAEADVVIFNTCTIRENADLKLYSALGQNEAIKEARPQMQIAVGGCMAQKDATRSWNAPTGRRRVRDAQPGFGTAVTRALTFRGPDRRGPGRPDHEVNRDMAPRSTRCASSPSRPGSRFRRGVITPAPTASCPSVRGEEISRRSTLVLEAEMLAASGVSEITLLGQNVNSYGRDSPVDAPSSPISWRGRRVEGIERIRYTSPTPRTEPRRSRRWSKRRRSARSCISRCSPARTGC